MVPARSQASGLARLLVPAAAAVLVAFSPLPLLRAAERLVPAARAADSRDTATVTPDKVAVHAAMRLDSDVRSELKKGDVVRVELEVSGGPDGAWSSISDLEGMRLGYVPSAALERTPTRRARWTVASRDASPEPRAAETRPARTSALATIPRLHSEVQVEFFAASWCHWCDKTRVVLRDLGVSVTEYDVDQPERKAELRRRSGQGGVPYLDIEGITILGFGEESIRKAVEKRRTAR